MSSEETLDTTGIAQAAEVSAAEREAAGHATWRVTLYATWVAQLFAMVGFSFVMPFIPFYLRELGVQGEGMLGIWSGLMVTGSGVVMSVAAPCWGWVADHYGRKPMVQRAMFGGAVILSLMGLARNAYQLFGLRVVQGAVTGTVAASVALVSSVTPRAFLGYSLGLMQTAVFVGGSLGPLVGGVVADRYGYRIPFLVTGALLLCGGLLVLFGARERFKRPTPEERAKTSSRGILRSPGVPGLLMVFLLLNLSGSFVGPIFPLFVEEVLKRPGRAASETGIILAATGVSSAVASVLVGRMSDRVGHKRVLVACTALAGLLCFPQAIARNVGQLLCLRVLFGLGAGGMIPAMNAMVARTVPRDRIGRAYGFVTTASSVGWATGPALGGLAASACGLRVPFAIMGGLLLAMSLATQKGLRTQAQE
jgi:DHA1 family multidrug resistance protein-like MFS transporter